MDAVSLILLIACGTVWGVSFSLIKVLVGFGAHPLALTMIAGFLGGILLLAWCAIRRRGIPLSRAHLVFYVVAGILGSVFPSAALYGSAPHLPAGLLAILTGLSPLMTYLLVLAMRIEGFNPYRFGGLFLGLAAVFVIVVPAEGLPASATVGWVLVAMAAAASYACEDVYIALNRPRWGDSAAIVCGMMFASGVVLLPVAWAGGMWGPLIAQWSGILPWAVGTAAVNVVSYVLFLELIRRAGPVYAAQTAYVITATGVAWGMVLFGERHSVWIWSAVAMLFAGLILVGRHQPKAGRVPDGQP